MSAESRNPAAAAREAALQMWYAHELGGEDLATISTWYLQAHPLPPRVRVEALAMVDAVRIHSARIEALLRQHAVGWRLERFSVIDRSLAKLATAELLLAPALPAPGVIQSALRLAKRFSQPEAVGFLHALLDAVARDLAAPAKD